MNCKDRRWIHSLARKSRAPYAFARLLQASLVNFGQGYRFRFSDQPARSSFCLWMYGAIPLREIPVDHSMATTG